MTMTAPEPRRAVQSRAGDQPPAGAPCPECGSLLEPGRTCRDAFHDLLLLEARVPGAPGAEPHFLAVATYNLQHPAGFDLHALVGLRQTVADVLAGTATVADARRRARAATDGAVRVRRRDDDPVPDAERAVRAAWPTVWSTTVSDVVAVPPERYVEQVRAWAAAVCTALDGPTKPASSATARPPRSPRRR